VETARRAEADGADYLGVGPVWGTVTKPGLPPPIGLERLAEVAQAVSVPVIAIGGVTAGNAADAVRAGAAGVAVIGAVAGAADPEAAARALRRALDGAGG
jgi:thiamine-phosphate pyrophosphorylase